jgi:ABC-type branched-subunit amino acid transport system substrate-binding protein
MRERCGSSIVQNWLRARRTSSDAAVESAPVSKASRQVSAVALLAALAWAVAPVAEAQSPIRIGATLSQTGAYAALGQSLLGGYQLCVKHTNAKGGVRSEARTGCLRRRVRPRYRRPPL